MYNSIIVVFSLEESYFKTGLWLLYVGIKYNMWLKIICNICRIFCLLSFFLISLARGLLILLVFPNDTAFCFCFLFVLISYCCFPFTPLQLHKPPCCPPSTLGKLSLVLYGLSWEFNHASAFISMIMSWMSWQCLILYKLIF